MSDNPMDLPKEGWKPSRAKANPTTWRSTPVCATEAMIEAGIAAIRQFIHHPADVERRIVKAAVNAALLASPRPLTVSQWLPIESAPNAEVLLYFPPKPMGRHNQMMQPSMYRVGRADEFPRRPTHWHPLPDAPAIGDAGHG